jgi:hypothetical protein
MLINSILLLKAPTKPLVPERISYYIGNRVTQLLQVVQSHWKGLLLYQAIMLLFLIYFLISSTGKKLFST